MGKISLSLLHLPRFTSISICLFYVLQKQRPSFPSVINNYNQNGQKVNVNLVQTKNLFFIRRVCHEPRKQYLLSYSFSFLFELCSYTNRISSKDKKKRFCEEQREQKKRKGLFRSVSVCVYICAGS